MEKITTNEAEEIEEDFENMDNLKESYTQEELAQMCAGFARENMRLIRWLYKYHLSILRDYENKYMDGKHIYFGD